MAQNWLCNAWKLRLASSLVLSGIIIFSSGNSAFSQVVPDGTLLNESSTKDTTYTIRVTPGRPPQIITNFNIRGGAIRGTNLFHSFQEFSFENDQLVYFDNAFNIQNIISRVTGSSISNIRGTLRANGTANLFLINPNGIILGPGASLDIGGSFVATTANAIQFGDQGVFSASAPNIPPATLTIDPSAFLFNQLSQQPVTPQPIQILDSTLNVREGKSLLLAGGDVIVDNSFLYIDYFEGGRIELGGVAGAGTVGLNTDGNNLSLSFPNGVERANVSFTNTLIDVSAEGGGSLVVNADNLDISDSVLFAGIGQGLGSADTQAGDITLNATGILTITDSYIANLVDIEATGQGGNINIQAGSFSADGSVLEASTYGQGNAGSVFVQVNDAVSLSSSAIFSNVETGAVGNGGGINITSGSFSADSSFLEASTYGQGNAGSISVQTQDAASFSWSDIYSNVAPDAVGNGGDISINAGAISITDEALLSATTAGQGNAGTIFLQAEGAVSLARNSGILSNVEAGGVGDSGGINIDAQSLSMTDGAQMQTIISYDRDASDGYIPSGRGDAGDVNINVRDDVTLVGQNRASGTRITAIFTGVGFVGEGDGGDININARSLSLTNAPLGADTVGYGDGGDISIRVTESISLTNTDDVLEGNRRARIGSAVAEGAVGNGGDLDIQARSLSLANGATLDASTQSNGDGGDIRVSVNTLTAVNGGQIFTTSRTNGNAGDIYLDITGSTTLSGSDPLFAERRARTLPSVVIPDSAASGVFARTEGGGSAGDVQLNTTGLIVRDGAGVSTATSSTGQGGQLRVRASESVEVTGTSADGQLISSLSTETLGAGNAGNLWLETGQLRVQDGARVSAATRGTGDGGGLTVNATDSVGLSRGGGLFTETSGDGDAGSLTINTRQLSVEDRARASAATSGTGEGGGLIVNASDSVQLSRGGGLFTETSGDGNAGGLTVNTRQLNLQDEALISASTSGTGRGSSLQINASESVQLSRGGGLFAQSTGMGDAGDLQISTGQLIVEDGARASAATAGTGEGGRLTVDAANSVQLSRGGGLFTETSGAANAGNLSITTTQLNVEDNALVSASTSGTGRGGNLRVNASQSVGLNNQGGLFAQSAGWGDAGNLEITTGQLVVQNQAQITVSSQGSRTAGNLEVTADSVFLNNQAKLQAETASGDGGNITLRLQDSLLMRHNSLISTTAGTAGAGGDGGNININAQFIIAVPSENSDITANAFEGRGGNVLITTEGIFGTQFRPQLTSESDITASSQFGVNGTVQINTPGIDPSRGLNSLPADFDATNQITESCGINGTVASEQSEFKIAGRGGLPPSPKDALSNDAVQIDWVALKPRSENRVVSAVSENATNPQPTPVVEAQGWVVNENGKIALVAAASTAHRSRQILTACRRTSADF